MYLEYLVPTGSPLVRSSRPGASVACCAATWAIARTPPLGSGATNAEISGVIVAGTLRGIPPGGVDPVVAAWVAGGDAHPRTQVKLRVYSLIYAYFYTF